jgi:hypothetical protein
MSKLGWQLIIGGLIVILTFGGGFWAGYKTKKCPEITHDTISVVDPYWHHIADSLAGLPPNEIVKWLPQDTIKLPGDTIKLPVDSTTIKAMLKDYLATYTFSHEFEKNDTLDAKVKVIVKQNHPIWYGLDYKFKIPFNTIINTQDNSITYNDKLLLGLSVPMYRYAKDSVYYHYGQKISLDLTYASKKGYFGVMWQPFEKVVGAKFGTVLINFKQKKQK